MFINKSDRIAISAEGVVDAKDITPDQDIIIIRRKMDFGTKQKWFASFDTNVQTTASMLAASLALLELNILEWQGPSFAGVPLTRESIEMLDTDEPLVVRVLTELNERNTFVEPSPNAKTAKRRG